MIYKYKNTVGYFATDTCVYLPHKYFSKQVFLTLAASTLKQKTMRGFALGLIIVSDFIMWFTHGVDINPTGLSFLLTLILVIIVAFASSAMLRNAQSLKMTRNYTISGILGIVLGIVFFFWIRDNTAAVIAWFNQYGLVILLGINILAALYIFFAKKTKKETGAIAEQPN